MRSEAAASVTDYEKLLHKKELKNLLLSSPHKDIEIPVNRNADKGREISF